MCSKLYDKFSRELIPHMQKRTSPSKVRFLTGQMPPPARVCTACKASKARCVDFAAGVACKRCSRLGLCCEPAPTLAHMSRARAFVKSTASAMFVESDCQASTRQAGGELSVCPGKNYALVADAGRISLQHCRRQLEWTDCTMSRKQQLSVLRHVSALARRRDNHDVLALVIDACRTHGHTLDSVLGSLIGTAADEEPAVALVLGGDQDTPNISSLPPETVHLVSTSSTCN